MKQERNQKKKKKKIFAIRMFHSNLAHLIFSPILFYTMSHDVGL